jgi:hypothetical protein
MVTRVDRLARSIRDLQDIIHELRERWITLKATEQPIDTRTASGKAFLACGYWGQPLGHPLTYDIQKGAQRGQPWGQPFICDLACHEGSLDFPSVLRIIYTTELLLRVPNRSGSTDLCRPGIGLRAGRR